jgi:hypothetical protein
LGDLPNYHYQLIVTKKRCSSEAVWRFYNGRAESENRIKDFKSISMVRTLWEWFLYWGGQIVRDDGRVDLELAKGSAEARRFKAVRQ